MFKDIKWLRLTPDRPGRGGTKTGFHTFQQQPVNDVRSLTGGHVYQGAWRREFSAVPYPSPQFSPIVAGSFPNPVAVHGYVYPSTTDPGATPSVTVLEDILQTGAINSRFIYDVNTGTQRMPSRGGTGIPPAVFQNINGRCFIGDGMLEGIILDDRTPAIHAQPDQNLGIGTPQQALTPGNIAGIGVAISPQGTGYIYTNKIFLNHPNPNNQLGTILATDTVTLTVINSGYGIYSGATNAPASPLLDAVTSNVTPFTATGTISITTGTSLITLAGATWPAGFKYAGLAINFNGFSYVLQATGDGIAVCYDVNGAPAVLTNVQAYILGQYDGPTITGMPYTITGCQVTFAGNTNTNLEVITAGTPGYSQSTHSDLIQIRVFCTRANGLYRNLGNISLGPVGGGTRSTVTDARVGGGIPFVSSPSSPWVQDDVGKTIVIDMQGTAIMHITTIASVEGPEDITLTTVPGGVGALLATRAWWGIGLTGGADISNADAVPGPGADTTWTSPSNPWVATDVGKDIMIEGGGAAGIALFTTITGFVSTGTITTALPNASGAPIVTNKAEWGSGTAGTTTGPTYAYAWYDPETGHCSNISPLYQVPRPTVLGLYADFSNLSCVFQVDPGAIQFPEGLSGSTKDGNRFSHILFFRTLSTPGSSTLYPIGSLSPFVGKVHPGSASTLGSWNPMMFYGWFGIPNTYVPALMAAPATPTTYWYDWSSDSDLLLSGGFRAPQETNSKPMVLLRGGATQPGHPYAMVYWDRRTWIVNTQEPDVIAFSCDEAQCPLGLPEESFPPTNRLRIPSTDGRVIALKTVGSALLVTTDRWAYLVAGNNESNYRLMKVSASMPGVGYYQMDEFPTISGAEGEPTTLFYLGRDRKVYQWTFGAQAIPISGPIQDQLDQVLSGGVVLPPLLQYQLSYLHCVSAWGRRLVVVAPNAQSYADIPPKRFSSQVHFWDIDNQVWSEGFHPNAAQEAQDGLAPMTTVYGLDVPANELFAILDPASNHAIVQSWLRNDTTGTSNYFTITTFPMNFDGKKTRKQICAMNLHATAGSWGGGVFVNEATTAVSAIFTAYTDPLYSIYAPIATPVDPGAQDIVILAGQFSNSAPVVGYRFVVFAQKYLDSNPAKVYALDIGYIEYEEPGDGDP